MVTHLVTLSVQISENMTFHKCIETFHMEYQILDICIFEKDRVDECEWLFRGFGL